MVNFAAQSQLVYERRIIMGLTKFKGTIEGTAMDTCNVLIALPLNDTSGNGVGFGVAKVPFGTSNNYDRYSRLEFIKGLRTPPR